MVGWLQPSSLSGVSYSLLWYQEMTGLIWAYDTCQSNLLVPSYWYLDFWLANCTLSMHTKQLLQRVTRSFDSLVLQVVWHIKGWSRRSPTIWISVPLILRWNAQTGRTKTSQNFPSPTNIIMESSLQPRQSTNSSLNSDLERSMSKEPYRVFNVFKDVSWASSSYFNLPSLLYYTTPRLRTKPIHLYILTYPITTN